MTSDFGVASRKILQLWNAVQINISSRVSKLTYHSSSSTLKVLAWENMLSYAPIRVMIASTGLSLNTTLVSQDFLMARINSPRPGSRNKHSELCHNLTETLDISKYIDARHTTPVAVILMSCSTMLSRTTRKKDDNPYRGLAAIHMFKSVHNRCYIEWLLTPY